jgi:hypothetical protein
MHSYRRGGRSHVYRRRQGCARKATAEEVTEHGRWRSKRSSMDMPTAYNKWKLWQIFYNCSAEAGPSI